MFFRLSSVYFNYNNLNLLSSALDEAAAALTRMRIDPSQGDGTSLVAACSQVSYAHLRAF